MRWTRKAAMAVIMVILAGCGSGGGADPVAESSDREAANISYEAPPPVQTGSGAEVGTEPPTTEIPETGDVQAPPVVTAPSANKGIDDIKAEMLIAVNNARSTGRYCGSIYHAAAAQVGWNDRVAAAAYGHSADMAGHSFLSHTGSDGSTLSERITREGYVWRALAENVAAGYPSVGAVVQGWLGSEGHCRNIMNPQYKEIGAAYADGTYGGAPARYWTLDLATPR